MFDNKNIDNREYVDNRDYLFEQKKINKKKPRRIGREIFEWIKFICFTLVIYFLISNFVFQVNLVQGRSMYPTLHHNDRVIVNKIPITVKSDFARGDIITINADKLNHPLINNDIVKRIVGLPGEKVTIKNGNIYINDSLLTENYVNENISSDNIGVFNEIVLAEDEYFVLGDNRNHSTDSRIFGAVHIDAIMGKLFLRIYPFKSFGLID